MKERIIELLGAGVTPTQVAMAIGCDESYVSQLMAQEEVFAEVTNLRTITATKHIQHDQDLDSDEEFARKLIRRNLEIMPLKPMELLAHFKVLNGAKRKSDAAQLNSNPVGTVVTLELPAAAAVQFKLTVDKQVIEVDGRSMTPMPAQQVSKMLNERRAKRDLQAITDVPNSVRIETPSILDTI